MIGWRGITRKDILFILKSTIIFSHWDFVTVLVLGSRPGRLVTGLRRTACDLCWNCIHRYSSSYRFDGWRWGKLEWCFWFNRILLLKKIRNRDTRPATYIINIFPRQEVKSKLVCDFSSAISKSKNARVKCPCDYLGFMMSDIYRTICRQSYPDLIKCFYFSNIILKVLTYRCWRKVRFWCNKFSHGRIRSKRPLVSVIWWPNVKFILELLSLKWTLM